MTSVGPEVGALVNPRILVCEDEKIVARDIELSLKGLGWIVCGTVASGTDAVAKAEALRPDLVLMDIRLQGELDGIEAARQIRDRMRVPVVFLTAYADARTLERAAQVEPYGYVLKPFEDRELHVTLMMALCKHRAFLELDARVRERTDELARSEIKYRQIAAVAELGVQALRQRDLQGVIDRTMRTVAATLESDLVSLFELTADGSALVLRGGIGWPQELIGTARLSAAPDAFGGFTLASPQPVVVEDLRSERRFTVPSLLLDEGAVSGMSAIVQAVGHAGRPFGVLSTHGRHARAFSTTDVSFLRAVANMLASAVDRMRIEVQMRVLERQSEEERSRTARAEDALRERDEFISVAAHELRTPLTALQLKLQGLISVMRRGGLDATLAAGLGARVDGALRQGERLTELVERLLDVSRIASGSLELRGGEIDLGALAHEVVASMQEHAERVRSRMRVEVRGDVTGRWDRDRMEQVLQNLLSNALKYGAGTAIEVVVEDLGAVVRASVRDGGIGIAPEDVERIFGRFERATPVKHYGGLGLGLFVARHIIEAHGGRITVESSAGKGATFAIEVPRRVLAVAKA